MTCLCIRCWVFFPQTKRTQHRSTWLSRHLLACSLSRACQLSILWHTHLFVMAKQEGRPIVLAQVSSIFGTDVSSSQYKVRRRDAGGPLCITGLIGPQQA